jgi:hypothetical protein
MSIGARGLVLLCGVVALLQGCVAPPPPKHTLDASLRSVVGGRDALVVVQQRELYAEFVDFSPGTANSPAAELGAGIIGIMISVHRENSAEKRVQPLRAALGTYDFGAQALDAARSAVAKIPWLDVKQVALTTDGSTHGVARALEQSEAAQLLILNYRSTISADWQKIRVELDASIYPKGVREVQLGPYSALHVQKFFHVETLAQPARKPKQNVALWAADGAAPARAALDAGLAGVNDLLVQSLSQSPDSGRRFIEAQRPD